jgi:mannosyltransferase PIG-V
VGRRSSSAAWFEAAAIVLATRVLFWFVAYASAWLTAPPDSGPASFTSLWEHWDARHFIEVATYGYTDPHTDPHASAFFPAFPLLIRFLDGVGMNPVFAGMFVSTVATIVAAAYLHKLATHDAGPGAGRRAVWYLVFFPTAVFLVAPYSEALFLAGAIPAFYYARQGQWGMVAVPAALAVATRAAGIFLLFGLAVEFVRMHNFSASNIRRSAAALVAASLPLIAYGAYLANIEGSPFHFFVDQREGWSREPTWPWAALANTWSAAFGPDLDPNFVFAFKGELVAAAVGIAVVVWALARREWGYAAFMGSLLVALLTSFWYLSVPRILLTFFPALVFLAGATGRGSRHELTLALFAPLAAMGVVVFTRGAWFY